MTTSELIRSFRMKAGLTQQDLAEKVGVTRESIAQYETGRNDPSTKVYIKILKALKIEQAEPRLKTEQKQISESSETYNNSKSTSRAIVDQLLDENSEMRDLIIRLREEIVKLESERNTYKEMYIKFQESVVQKINPKLTEKP